ncbi:GCN5 family acetyltransferase [Stenotrophomonas daejeonensis]|uniref:GCN5 family acetyltransferase n=1 Tax=Stenotrophomonas daejeonensis TaxID=659018 RepID=A0A0R0DLT7_9GAMM|nr:GNAT family N-acetyltransferase [Stenotrophomonas daejeonensis]KRG82973.1 GCN5 family acetyltransferase [Stenotrophomonas daejeonensis]
MRLPLAEPVPLAAMHRLDDFDCGESELDDWLRRRALVNQLGGASRTFVVADADNVVRGYYALAAGAISHGLALGKVKRNMPDPVPAIVLGRLAVDRPAHGLGLGGDLLMDAVRRVIGISEQAGVRAMLVHALHERAQRFYEHFGFESSPLQPLVLMLRLGGERNS